MAEFDEKLNSLLSDPGAMAQIMQLAQSLSLGQEASAPPAKPAPPPAEAPSPPGGNADPQMLLRLLPLIRELGGQSESNARTLLFALQPYLKAERRQKVERALQLARLFHVGKQFLSGWEG